MIMLKRYLLPDWPAPQHVKAFSTLKGSSKEHGYSRGPFAFFNLATHTGDNMVAVNNNRSCLKSDWNWKKNPCWLNQVHSTHVIAAHTTKSSELLTADASWTDQQDLPCIVMTADCLPVLFCNKEGTKVAAVHAGWRGLLNGILENTVYNLNESSGQLIAWLGPAISQPCFEVGPEVRNAFINFHAEATDAFIPGKNDRWQADIYQLARLRLHHCQIENVYGGNACTVSQEANYFSYRRDGQTGRMATAVWVNHNA